MSQFIYQWMVAHAEERDVGCFSEEFCRDDGVFAAADWDEGSRPLPTAHSMRKTPSNGSSIAEETPSPGSSIAEETHSPGFAIAEETPSPGPSPTFASLRRERGDGMNSVLYLGKDFRKILQNIMVFEANNPNTCFLHIRSSIVVAFLLRQIIVYRTIELNS